MERIDRPLLRISHVLKGKAGEVQSSPRLEKKKKDSPEEGGGGPESGKFQERIMNQASEGRTKNEKKRTEKMSRGQEKKVAMPSENGSPNARRPKKEMQRWPQDWQTS